jgi:g-D-glutamyl-meso-diaminopimelate peptidase
MRRLYNKLTATSGGLPMNEGYTYANLVDDLARLSDTYPFVHIESIGQSVMGREIPAICLGTGSKEIHFNAAMHANEWITAPLLMRFAQETAAACGQGIPLRGKDMKRIFSETCLWLVPMVNPDGVELVQNGISSYHPYFYELLTWNEGSLDFRDWKANIRGVDLNDQFPAYWEVEQNRRGLSGPGKRDFGGLAPLSEPEAAALVQFTCAHNFQLVMSLHTQGREIYWNYREFEPYYARAMAEHFARISGYTAVKLTDSDAGYKDWFIQEFGRPGFTIEVGLGTNPLPPALLPQMYEEVVGILLEGLEV